ncbi:MAG: DUF3501 family protein [Deltaproteobacteria bacterium]|nr:DUF3501 family protein [Deltaproteobacteria bacterium]MBW2160312.1 DUF3501 family protein [Deltaproteobacteria bacterium]MBW2586885.1 DUF3501 family protein [Deltaproteobacteria bacterium]
MKRVERSEILDYVTYGEQRGAIRDSALRAKSVRRILVGECFTFLFENHETVLYQIQEMMRIEHIVKEDDIQHELDTYNQLIHPAGTVGCTLLVGIDDEELRDQKLREWMGLNDHIYAKLPDGSLARPTWDSRQVGDTRLSAVQYLSFALGPDAPVAISIEMPGIEAETELSDAQRGALREDLSAG